MPAAAQAATCSTSHGVTVVVDFHQLGGGVETACDAGGAGRAAVTQLTDVGHQLTYVQRQPGFVCRVDGPRPSDPCVNTPPSDAYWSLWWSDGRSGTWTYSSAGVGALQVPDGGYVALSWQGSDGKAAPRVTPTASRRLRPRPPASRAATRRPSTTASPRRAVQRRALPATHLAHSGPLHPSTRSRPPRSPAPAPEGASADSTTQPAPHAGTGDGAAGPVDATPARAPGCPAGSRRCWSGRCFVAAATVAVVRRKRSGGA